MDHSVPGARAGHHRAHDADARHLRPRPVLDRSGRRQSADERDDPGKRQHPRDAAGELPVRAAPRPARPARDEGALRQDPGRTGHRRFRDIRQVSSVQSHSGRTARTHQTIGLTMPARPTWKGYLKISLVNIPIKVFPATDAGATLSFNQLHAECQTRIQQKRWCPHCQREVANTDLVKGFEFEKGRYVVVDEEDIEKVRVDSTRVINLEKFTDDTEIDPIYLERPYYLAPDGPVAREAFSVI